RHGIKPKSSAAFNNRQRHKPPPTSVRGQYDESLLHSAALADKRITGKVASRLMQRSLIALSPSCYQYATTPVFAQARELGLPARPSAPMRALIQPPAYRTLHG